MSIYIGRIRMVSEGFKKFQKIYNGFEGFLKVFKGFQRFLKISYNFKQAEIICQYTVNIHLGIS